MIYIVFIFALILCVYSQVPFFGTCPNVTVVEDFNIDKYLGKWYEAEKYFAWFEAGAKCITAEYNVNSNGTVTVYNAQTSALTGIKSWIEGKAYQVGRTDEAKLIVNFPSLPVHIDAPYWVLGTDYDSYSVVWSCSNFHIFSLRSAWILTRDPTPYIDTLKKAYDVIDANRISRAFFFSTDQKNCPKKY